MLSLYGLHSPWVLGQFNFLGGSAALLGMFLLVAGALLFALRSFRPELSRDQDIVVAAIALLCGCILLFQGWRLDPILQFGQFLLAGVATWFAAETIRLRQATNEQARRSAPPVDRERRSSRVYRAEIDEIEPFDEPRPPMKRQLRGTDDYRRERDPYERESYGREGSGRGERGSYGRGSYDERGSYPNEERDDRPPRRPSRNPSRRRPSERPSERPAAATSRSRRTRDRYGYEAGDDLDIDFDNSRSSTSRDDFGDDFGTDEPDPGRPPTRRPKPRSERPDSGGATTRRPARRRASSSRRPASSADYVDYQPLDGDSAADSGPDSGDDRDDSPNFDY